MTVHMRYNSWYIILPSSAKQQREMTKFYIVCRKGTTTTNVLNFFFKYHRCMPDFDSFERKKKIVKDLRVIDVVHGVT